VRAAAGMSEAVPSDGGFLVQPELAYDLLQQGMKAAKLAPLCRPFPIGENANGVRLPMVHETSRANGQRFGGLQLYWPNEGDSATPSKPKFRMLEMVAKKLVGLIYLTDELLQDVSVLNAYVTQAFRDEFGFVIDDKIFRGTGAGQPLGFLNSNALVTVSPVNAQPADTIITANVLSMYARNSSPTTSLWLANVNALPQLASLSLLIGTAGAPIGLLKDGIATSPTGFTILGRPLIFMEQSASIGDAGDIAFVDPQQYMLASRGGLQTALSMHVRFLTDEGTLRFVYRLDGQPIPAVAVTPYMGTGDTVSPFVILGAR
jgi:HK97 family phage major capsid protein